MELPDAWQHDTGTSGSSGSEMETKIICKMAPSGETVLQSADNPDISSTYPTIEAAQSGFGEFLTKGQELLTSSSSS